jgi:hypothetical protein
MLKEGVYRCYFVNKKYNFLNIFFKILNFRTTQLFACKFRQ